MEQAREGNEGLHARRHVGPFQVWRGLAGKECRGPSTCPCPASAVRTALGMTGFSVVLENLLRRDFFGAALLAEFLEVL